MADQTKFGVHSRKWSESVVDLSIFRTPFISQIYDAGEYLLELIIRLDLFFSQVFGRSIYSAKNASNFALSTPTPSPYSDGKLWKYECTMGLKLCQFISDAGRIPGAIYSERTLFPLPLVI